MKNNRLCMLMILDGWGIGERREGNAVLQAHLPNLARLGAEYPGTHLLCSGRSVGLPDGIMGNSEVGHLNIGAGRIVYQDILRIDVAIGDGNFFENAAFRDLFSKIRDAGGRLHLIGLLSDGGVHSHIGHLFALIDLAVRESISGISVHPILDGRDTAPDSGAGFVARLSEKLKASGAGKIATICGRYFAMDRDGRWDRVEKAYRLLTRGEGTVETDPVEAVRNAYRRGETDEFVRPIVLSEDGGPPDPPIRDGDGVIFFNFRADRAREITRALTDPEFSGFPRDPFPRLSGFVGMTRYDERFNLPMAFPPVRLEEILGEIVGGRELRQLRIAETEKYAHVTYFFNGGDETPFPLEDRCLIPSPRDVATYDQKPEMSAHEVTREALGRIRSGIYDLIVLNFANMDMVGHTGVMEAAVRACEALDGDVGEIASEVRRQGGALLITADHGNAEKMLDGNGNVHTAHTLNPVPFILVDDTRKNAVLRPGILADIAPTILEILGIAKPGKMTGRSLLTP